MRQFPDLKRWFEVTPYYELNNCRAISLSLKRKLTTRDLVDFSKEFAKLICRIRLNQATIPDAPDLCRRFQNAIDGLTTLESHEIKYLKYLFFEGIISGKRFKSANQTINRSNWSSLIDNEAFNGHFGEVLFYVLREQCFEDNKLAIEPQYPKNSSKIPGLDYIEIRKSSNGLYFVIGEIKTSINTIGNYPDTIIDTLKNRTKPLFFAIVNHGLKEQAKASGNSDLKRFVDEMPMLFFNSSPSIQKRFAGLVVHGGSRRPQKSVFRKFKSECQGVLNDCPDCRRIKFTGIKGLKYIKEKVLEEIWKPLLA